LGGKGNFAVPGVILPANETSVNMAGPSPSSGSPLLSVRDVSVRFGGTVALDGVTFDVSPPDRRLDRSNGAGKTTLFNCLSRLYTPNAAGHPVEACRSSAAHVTTSRRSHRPHLPKRGTVRSHVVLDNVRSAATAELDELLRQRSAPAQGRPEEAHISPARP